jgi:hypothetical protein
VPLPGYDPAMSSRSRNILSVVLVVLGGVATLCAAAAIYAHNVFVDRNGFANSVTEAVKQPAVSREISVRLGNALVNAYPDSIAGERVIEDATASLIRSGALDPVVRKSALELHDAVFTGSAEKLALDLGDGLQLLGSFAATRDPKLRGQITALVDAKVVEIQSGGMIGRISRIGGVIDALVVGLPILALLLLGGAVAVASDRRKAMGLVGWAIALSGPAFFIVGIVLDASIRNRGWANPDAVDQAVGAFLSDVKWVALVLAVAGASIIASAAGRLSTDTADRTVERTWDYLRRGPVGRRGRVVRALVFLAVGVQLLSAPLFALKLVLVGIGFLAVVEGMTEIAAALAGASSRPAEATSPTPSRPSVRHRIVEIGAVALGVLVLAGIGGLALVRAPGGNARLTLACNGSPKLCDRPIDRVAFPTAHNAMSSAEDGFIDPNHRRSLIKHLDAGIRGLLVDSLMARPTDRPSSALTVIDGQVRETAQREIGDAGVNALQDFLARRLAKPTGPPEPFLCHIVCELGALPMKDELEKIRDWMKRNPDEVIVLVIQDLVSPQETERVFRESGLYDYAYTWKPGAPAPTLRHMIETDKRLLVMAEENGFPGGWYQPGYARLLKETPYDTATVEGLRSDASCRANRGNESNPLFLINHWVAVYPPRPSKAFAVNERRFMLDRVERCRKIRNAFPNLIAVDFAGIGDVVDVAAEINGVKAS